MIDREDEALTRLHNSDPATGSHPDLHSLRRAIGSKAPASLGEGDAVTHLSDDTLAGPRVRAPWIAAAAVAALGIGAGGYALGTQSVDPAPAAKGGNTESVNPASADSLDSFGPAASTAEAGSGSGSAGASADGGAGMNYDPGPVRLVAGAGLSSATATGPVRALVSDTDPDAFLADWKQTLGFEGKEITDNSGEAYGWFGGTTFINPDELEVLTASTQAGGPMHFSYEDLPANPYCKEMYQGSTPEDLTMMKDEWARSFGSDVPFPDASRCEEVSGAAPSEADAIAAAREFLATTNLDFSDYDLKAMDYSDTESRTVMIEGFPEDLPYGQLSVNVTVGPGGVVSASGSVGKMTSLGEYPVISPVEAVARYGQREFSMEYGVQIAEDLAAQTDIDPRATSLPAPDYTLPEPAEVEPGMKIPLLLKDKTVTKAELVSGSIYTQTGGTLEVPAWKLITEDGMHYVVLALAEDAIDWQTWK